MGNMMESMKKAQAMVQTEAGKIQEELAKCVCSHLPRVGACERCRVAPQPRGGMDMKCLMGGEG